MEQRCESDMEALQAECSRRVSELEKRLHVTVMEKDAMKLSLHEAEMELSRRQVASCRVILSCTVVSVLLHMLLYEVV